MVMGSLKNEETLMQSNQVAKENVNWNVGDAKVKVIRARSVPLPRTARRQSSVVAVEEQAT